MNNYQMQSKLLLIIPAYNEEENLVKVVDNIINNYSEYDYVIVNDGSSDQTRKLCVDHKYNYVDYPVNLGLTSAFRGGLFYALCSKYDYVMQYDGDGQHNPDYIREILNKAISTNADIVIGSRFVNARKPLSARMVGGRIIAGCMLITTGEKIHDPTSGMRLYNRHAMELIWKNKDFGPEPDALVHLIRNGLKVIEIPVEMRERKGGTSYLNLSNSIKYMFRMCFSILIVEFLRKKEK